MMQILDCEQYSDEWWKARFGIPTSSQFSAVIAKNRSGTGPGVTRQTYMRKLAGEIMTGAPMDNYKNAQMERGHEMEDEARKFYALMTDLDPESVGFIRNSHAGCSPDSLIGKDGVLEIKTKAPHLLIEWIEKDQFPPEHKAQCQGQLWVAERKWIDLAAYWPGMPLFTVRAHRDEEYIKMLEQEVARFNGDLLALVDRLRAYGRKEAA